MFKNIDLRFRAYLDSPRLQTVFVYNNTKGHIHKRMHYGYQLNFMNHAA